MQITKRTSPTKTTNPGKKPLQYAALHEAGSTIITFLVSRAYVQVGMYDTAKGQWIEKMGNYEDSYFEEFEVVFADLFPVVGCQTKQQAFIEAFEAYDAAMETWTRQGNLVQTTMKKLKIKSQVKRISQKNMERQMNIRGFFGYELAGQAVDKTSEALSAVAKHMVPQTDIPVSYTSLTILYWAIKGALK